jgi:hypothetical protein
MARIKGVPSTQAGLYVKIGYYFTRRGLSKVTGRETERMIEPLQMYAHLPVLFKGYGKLEQATSSPSSRRPPSPTADTASTWARPSPAGLA